MNANDKLKKLEESAEILGKVMVANANSNTLKSLTARISDIEKQMSLIKEEIKKREKELQEANEEVEKLKAEVVAIYETGSNVIDVTNLLKELSIDYLELSKRTHQCLISANILTIHDILLLSNDDLKEITNFNKNLYEEIQMKVKSDPSDVLSRISKKISKEINAAKLDRKMTKVFFRAYDVYENIRHNAIETGISFTYLGRYGLFSKYYALSDVSRNYLRSNPAIIGKLSSTFCEECLDGNHPKMRKLLCSEEITMDMIKDAIIEDITENITNVSEESKTYLEFKKFVNFVKKYDIDWL